MIQAQSTPLKENNLSPTAETILIVDDSPDNLHILGRILSDRGYKVNPAVDGQLALQFVQSTPPDLILLDIMMPKMDGYQVCKQLKASPTTKDIPVIFISALNEVFDIASKQKQRCARVKNACNWRLMPARWGCGTGRLAREKSITVLSGR